MNPKYKKRALKVLNQKIRFYQRKLTFQLEIKAENELKNGNLKVADLGDYLSNIERYEKILANLATIKRSIRVGDCLINIDKTQGVYESTLKAIQEAGLCASADEMDYLEVFPVEETYPDFLDWDSTGEDFEVEE